MLSALDIEQRLQLIGRLARAGQCRHQQTIAVVESGRQPAEEVVPTSRAVQGNLVVSEFATGFGPGLAQFHPGNGGTLREPITPACEQADPFMPVRLGSKTWCKCLKLATNPDLLKAPTNRSSGPWPTRHLPHPGARWPAS